MNLQLSPLIELQKLDLRIAELKEQRRKIPERLEMNEAPLREAKRLFRRPPLLSKRCIKERRSHEKDLEAHEDRIGKMKDRAAQLKTNQEYQAHLFEVELANKKRGEIEEKILLAMEQIEQTQRTIVGCAGEAEGVGSPLHEREGDAGRERSAACSRAGRTWRSSRSTLSGQVEKVTPGAIQQAENYKERSGPGTHQGRHLRRVSASIAATAGLPGQTRAKTSIPAPIATGCCIGKGSRLPRRRGLRITTKRRIWKSANPSRFHPAPASLS